MEELPSFLGDTNDLLNVFVDAQAEFIKAIEHQQHLVVSVFVHQVHQSASIKLTEG